MDISEYKDQDTDTSLTESESESEDLAASLALDECCLEPIRPSIDITVNEDEEDLPQKPGIFRLRGGYEDPLKNDPFVVKFPGMAGCPCTSVALTRLSDFATLRNKIVKNLKIFMEIGHLRSPGVLCQH